MTASPVPSADLIAAYCDHLRICSRSPRTIAARRDVLTRADMELPFGLYQATDVELAAWLYRDEWSKQTQATYFGAIRGFFTYCMGRHLDHDPTEALPVPKVPARVPRPVTDGQLRLILTTAHQPYRLWALLAAYLGARCIEIARLQTDDITQEWTYLRGKGGKERAVPTDRDVWDAAQALRSGPVAMVDGKRVDERYVSIRTAIYFRRQLLMPGVGLHRLRHWYLTKVAEESGDPRVAQVLAGHASLNTTMGYLQVTSSRQRAAVDALPRLRSADGVGEVAR
jgi:integrase/recombinase XerC